MSPPLSWSAAPDGTKSFALVVDDPDAPDPRAPRMTWVHWVLYDLPSTIRKLPEGVMLDALPTGTKAPARWCASVSLRTGLPGKAIQAACDIGPRSGFTQGRMSGSGVSSSSTRVRSTCDAILVQDVGLGGRSFLMTNEAYASQYIDHHIARHPELGPVVMSRQNLAQGDRHPWVAHGCLEGAACFADRRDAAVRPGIP